MRSPQSEKRRARFCKASRKTDIGSSSSKPTRRSRPNMSSCGTIAASPGMRSWSRKSPSICGESRGNTAAGRFIIRGLRYERERQGLFRTQDDRRQSGCSPYASGAGSDPGPWRRGSFQRIYARSAVAIRHPGLAQRAGNAGRNHAAATVVSVPPVESIVLGAHRAGTPSCSAGIAPACQKSARSQDRRTVRRTAAHDWTRGKGSASELDLVCVFSLHRRHIAAGCESLSKEPAAAGDRSSRRLSSRNGSTARTASARFFRRWPTRQ